MRLSFDDEESFKETLESLHFNNLPSDQNSQQQIGSSNSIPLQESERNAESIVPNIPVTLRRVGSSNSLSIQETRRCGNIQVCFDNPPSNPGLEITSATSTSKGIET